MKKYIYLFVFIGVLLFSHFETDAKSLFVEKESYTIVIDPGHGGPNSGTMSNENFKEKDILLKTAFALVKELEKYDNLNVYLTRDSDVDLTLTERAKFAKSVNADFLFSLHYNASENHSMFGTEVWIPLHAPYHSYCYKFAYLQQLEMQDLGLFSRGIKTRKNEQNTDYYGIIRDCVARKIPAVIIEHCYVDEERDISYCDEEIDYEEFGRRDAIAIAKFLGIYEDEYEVPDFLYDIKDKDIISDTYEDHVGPNVCKIEVENADYKNGVLTINVKASDKQTPIMYYSYSIDGGKTYSRLFAWPDADLISGEVPESFSLMLNIPSGVSPDVRVRAYNKFDIYKSSNRIKNLEVFASPTAPPPVVAINTPMPVVNTSVPEEKKNIIALLPFTEMIENSENPQELEITLKRFLLLFVFVLIWMFMFFLLIQIIHWYKTTKQIELKLNEMNNKEDNSTPLT